MKLIILLLFVLLAPIWATTQNIPACDSLVIDCCSFNTITPNTVTVEVSNYSSEIFPYPGFILFNTDMDTIAIETVNYYGIGWDQIFSLNIISPIKLPFEGNLALYTGFYETHVCTFPVTIADTILASIHHTGFDYIEVFPNPAIDKLSVKHNNHKEIKSIRINDLNGRLMKDLKNPTSRTINLKEFKPGFYFILITENDGSIYHSKFLKK